jgi:hypothetical protein
LTLQVGNRLSVVHKEDPALRRAAACILALLLVLPIAPPSAADRVETRENITYSLPDGWTVQSFSKDDGVALLEHKATGAVMRVARYGLAEPREAYDNREDLAGGQVLAWRYEVIPFFNNIFLEGRVTLPEAHIEMAMSNEDQKTRPAQEVGLAAMRRIAQTARVLGPRGCVGADCEAAGGVVKPD